MSVAPLDAPTPLERIVARSREIAVLPQVVFKITELTGSDDASTKQMEQAIVVDPGFSAKVLSKANSAYYGLPKKVTSIREALMFLGFKSIRQLALTVGVFDMFVGKTDVESLRRRAWWRHSVDSALAAKSIALSVGVEPEEAYACGLLHYIGKTLLDRHDPTIYDKVAMLITNGVSEVQAEQHLYGCHHVEVSVAMSRNWGFPTVLIEGLNYLPPDDDADDLRLRAATAMGHRIAKLALGGCRIETMLEPALPEWALSAVNIDAAHELEIVEIGIAAISEGAKLSI